MFEEVIALMTGIAMCILIILGVKKQPQPTPPGPIPTPPETVEVPITPIPEETKKIIDMEAVKVRFDEIAATPYDVEKNNCVDKMYAFGDYLLSIGAEDVNFVQIVHNNWQYTHCFIKWNGLAYDPTNTPPIFGADLEKYRQALIDTGFSHHNQIPGNFKAWHKGGSIVTVVEVS